MRIAFSVASILVALCAGGCGGRGATASTSEGAKAQFSVVWPEPSRLIHARSDLITIQAWSGEQLLSEGFVAKPGSSITLQNLPTYEIRFKVTAREASKPSVILSRSDLSYSLRPGELNKIDFILDSQVDRVELPPNITLGAGETKSFTPVAYNSQNQVILSESMDFNIETGTPHILGATFRDDKFWITGISNGLGSFYVTEAGNSPGAGSHKFSVRVGPPLGQFGLATGSTWAKRYGTPGNTGISPSFSSLSGELVWSRPSVGINVQLVVDGESNLYVASLDPSMPRLECLDGNTGSRLWSQTPNYQIVDMLVTNTGLLVCSQPGRYAGEEDLVARGTASGNIQWSFQYPFYGKPICLGISGKELVVGHSYIPYVSGFSGEGQSLWSSNRISSVAPPNSSGTGQTACYVGGKVVVQADDTIASVLETGGIEWQTVVEGTGQTVAVGSGLVSNGREIVSVLAGEVVGRFPTVLTDLRSTADGYVVGNIAVNQVGYVAGYSSLGGQLWQKSSSVLLGLDVNGYSLIMPAYGDATTPTTLTLLDRSGTILRTINLPVRPNSVTPLPNGNFAFFGRDLDNMGNPYAYKLYVIR